MKVNLPAQGVWPPGHVGRQTADEEASILRATRFMFPRIVMEWTSLPPLPKQASLVAGDESNVAARMMSADEEVEIYVRRSHQSTAAYRMEMILRDTEIAPCIVVISYMVEKSLTTLLLPFVPVLTGSPTAQIFLLGLTAGTSWEIAVSADLSTTLSRNIDAVPGSIRVATNDATRNAWRAVAKLINDKGIVQAIDEALA